MHKKAFSNSLKKDKEKDILLIWNWTCAFNPFTTCIYSVRSSGQPCGCLGGWVPCSMAHSGASRRWWFVFFWFDLPGPTHGLWPFPGPGFPPGLHSRIFLFLALAWGPQGRLQSQANHLSTWPPLQKGRGEIIKFAILYLFLCLF